MYYHVSYPLTSARKDYLHQNWALEVKIQWSEMKSWDLDPSVFTSSASQGNINTVYIFLHRQIDTNPRHLGRSTEDVIAELSKLPGFLASNERWLASVVAQLALKGCGYQEPGCWVAGSQRKAWFFDTQCQVSKCVRKSLGIVQMTFLFLLWKEIAYLLSLPVETLNED